MQRAMHMHPTVSELIPTVLGELKPLYALRRCRVRAPGAEREI
jgi:hypothetical protein